MAVRPIAAWLLWGLLLCSLGCSSDGTQAGLFSSLKPDDQNPADDPQSEWDFVGEEARKYHPIEKDPDPWWQMNFMSPRARAIERNLGVD